MGVKFGAVGGTFGYYKNPILFENVNFTIEKSEILTILGPNGVGKTTFLKCMMGFLKWNKGETIIDGKSFYSMSTSDIWKKISYVPQAKATIFPYSVMEMVLMGRNPHLGVLSMPSNQDQKLCEWALEELNIKKLKGKIVSELSGGELQMVLIARALVSEPDILILDEPESNLDIKNQLVILNIIQKLSEEKNIACIINTHYPAHALKISDKTIMFSNNTHHIYGNTKDIVNESNIRKFFEVDSRILELVENKKRLRTIFPIRICKS